MLATYIFRRQKEYALVEGKTLEGKKRTNTNDAEEECAFFRQHKNIRQNR